MPSPYTYTQIASCPISKSRNAVISKCSNGSYTIAQQAKLVEGDSIQTVFLKNAMHVDSLERLKEFSDMILGVIERLEGGESETIWDN